MQRRSHPEQRYAEGYALEYWNINRSEWMLLEYVQNTYRWAQMKRREWWKIKRPNGHRVYAKIRMRRAVVRAWGVAL